MGLFVAAWLGMYGIEQCPGALRLHWTTADAAASAPQIPFDRPRAGAPNLSVEQPTNRVLAALAQVDRRHWLSSLERVELRQGYTLLTPDAPIEFMYFPEGALVGLLHAVGPDGLEAPLALVGSDGLVGVAPFLGVSTERLRAEVLHPGSAWRLPAAALNKGPQPDESELRVVLRYLQDLNAQMSQAALCRLQHTLYQRLSRWLQDAFDRVPGSVLHIEPATLGTWLGTEPGALALATSQLVAEGVVEQQSGRITLLDRAQLAQRSCGCLQQVKQQTDPLLSRTP